MCVCMCASLCECNKSAILCTTNVHSVLLIFQLFRSTSGKGKIGIWVSTYSKFSSVTNIQLSIYSETVALWLARSLSLCSYVLGRNILSQSCYSLCLYVCIGLPRPAHPPKVKYSLSAHMSKGKGNGAYVIWENISLCEGVLVLEGQYIHTSRESHSFETEYFCPIHTYEQREREKRVDFMPFNCQEDCVRSSLPKNKSCFKIPSQRSLKPRQTCVCLDFWNSS